VLLAHYGSAPTHRPHTDTTGDPGVSAPSRDRTHSGENVRQNWAITPRTQKVMWLLGGSRRDRVRRCALLEPELICGIGIEWRIVRLLASKRISLTNSRKICWRSPTLKFLLARGALFEILPGSQQVASIWFGPSQPSRVIAVRIRQPAILIQFRHPLAQLFQIEKALLNSGDESLHVLSQPRLFIAQCFVACRRGSVFRAVSLRRSISACISVPSSSKQTIWSHTNLSK